MDSPASGTLALTHLSQQATAALANVTINFAVWKYEAPAEYQPLRNILTQKRKEAAEAGNLHVTACKLGALFGPILPKIPSLSKAYGKRASDIALAWASSARQSSGLGAFADHAGADGTSILAAATSGDAAIGVHLLACMLAQQFRADKATAAWEELVAERKAELLANPQSSIPIDTMMATRVDITTRELATWDSSVRAWLGLANSIQARRQKQLMLILDNVEGIVQNLANTYTTITSAWCEALTVMEKVIQGSAHTAQSGSLLLAVSSWHLYPDIICLGSTTTNVSFEDNLVGPGGALTVGLMEHSPAAPRTGVYWSLSLSRLRYYGDTQMAESVMNIDSSFVSLEDFCVVALGAASVHWSPPNANLDEACRTFIYLDMFARKECATLQKPWTTIFSETAQKLQGLEAAEKSFALRLFKLGQRNQDLFKSEDGCALFDIDPDSVNGLMQVFTKLCDEPRYKSEMLRLAVNSRLSDEKDCMCIVTKSDNKHEFTIELAVDGTRFKPETLHLRGFLHTHQEEQDIRTNIQNSLPSDRRRVRGGYLIPLTYSAFARSHHSVAARKNITRFAWVDPPLKITSNMATGNRKTVIPDVQLHEDDTTVPEDFEYLTFERIYGDDAVSLFSMKWWNIQIPNNMWEPADLRLALQQGSIRCVKLISRMRKHVASIRAFSAAYEALREMPQMKISLADVFNTPLHHRNWAPTQVKEWSEYAKSGNEQAYLNECFSIPAMKTSQVFASISSLLAGVHDLELEKLSDVMALSFQDSLFVVSALLDDPYVVSSQVVRIHGNIGRPGLALLIPPKNPKIRASDPSRWSLINHAEFDGQPQNSFTGTDMSVWFTDYERPVQQNTRSGEKFIEAFFLECVVSVYDHGRWIADVDVVHNKQYFRRYASSIKSSTFGQLVKRADAPKIITLDNWDEVLASSELNTRCIARASENWLGRLALATILQQKGQRVILLPSDADFDLNLVLESCTDAELMRSVGDNFEVSVASSHRSIIFVQ